MLIRWHGHWILLKVPNGCWLKCMLNSREYVKMISVPTDPLPHIQMTFFKWLRSKASRVLCQRKVMWFEIKIVQMCRISGSLSCPSWLWQGQGHCLGPQSPSPALGKERSPSALHLPQRSHSYALKPCALVVKGQDLAQNPRANLVHHPSLRAHGSPLSPPPYAAVDTPEFYQMRQSSSKRKLPNWEDSWWDTVPRPLTNHTSYLFYVWFRSTKARDWTGEFLRLLILLNLMKCNKKWLQGDDIWFNKYSSALLVTFVGGQVYDYLSSFIAGQ